MYSENRGFVQIIREICLEKNINFKLLSYNYIIELEKDNKVRHLIANRFDLNNEACGNIACDKYATFCVLDSQNVPACKHIMLFNPNTRKEYIPENGNYAIINELFSKNDKIVVKPNDGCKGLDVYLCNNYKEAELAINKIFKNSDSLSISPFYKAKTEYRTFYLDGEIKLVYAKEKPYVIGDGQSSLIELIKKEDFTYNTVFKQNLTFIEKDYVPAKGEKVEISWKFNLSGGAKPRIITKEDANYETICSLAKKAGKAMNAKFVTIDILETENDFLVLEINSGVTGDKFIKYTEDGYNIIKTIYAEAIDKMFQ